MLAKTMAKKEDPRVTRTRQWLQQALLDLMAEKSFEAITVQDIAGRATLNRVTFYAHFSDKYALLEYAMRAGFQKKLRAAVPEDAPFSPANLTRLLQAVAEMLAETKAHCPPPRGQLEPLMEKQIKAELYAVLFAWLAGRAGAARRQPTPEQTAMIASWAIYGAAVQWSQKEQPEPPAEFARQVQPLILAGLRPVGGGDGRRKSEVGSQKSAVRSRKSEVGSRKSEVGRRSP